MTDASQEKNQDPMQEQEMEEEQQLDEEEDINGPADEREEEVVEYPSAPSDVIDASSDLDDLQDHRTYKERFDDLLQSQYLNILIQSEAQFQVMSSHAEEDRSQFDFNFKAATLYGHNKKWLLYQVRDFLLRYPDVRGTTLVDFQDELKEKTTREFDVNEVSRLIQLAGAFGVN